MSFPDGIFLFVLALLLFGPKKLPVLARELGKWVGEFRRASNEFKMQMEDELRTSEQAERLRKIEEMQAAAPVAPPLTETVTEETTTHSVEEPNPQHPVESLATAVGEEFTEAVPETAPLKPLPIAGSGEVSIMPPATGLPTPRKSALSGLIQAIPAQKNETAETVESAAHGD